MTTDISYKDCKHKHLAALMELFIRLAENKDFLDSYPRVSSLFSGVDRFKDRNDLDGLEERLTRIYCRIHEKDVRYSGSELKELKKMDGYWCYAGGLTPLLMAGSYITSKTRLADYGAGNGLQGLLLQYLYRPCKVVQIELGSYMMEKGRKLQAMMEIPGDRVEWIRKNIMDVSPADFDFIYIYRPVRPDGQGRLFYERFARQLEAVNHPLTLFSVADCLKDFLVSGTFRVFYDDGHLRCFSNAQYLRDSKVRDQEPGVT